MYKTNVYKMPLYIIIEIMLLNTTYYIVFVFLLAKMVDDYYWILGIIEKLYEFFDVLNSKVIITSTNFNIICAILKEFLLASHLLYF